MMNRRCALGALALILIALAAPLFAGGTVEPAAVDEGDLTPVGMRPAPEPLPGERTAVLAGGCFWCMEEAFERVPGVREVVSGFAGGTLANPSYERVVGGRTGHIEVVKIYYDPAVITYEEILYVFWRNVDLLDEGGQFCDRGAVYRTAIFHATDAERDAAIRSKAQIEASGRFPSPVVTEILPLKVLPGDDNDGFWPAEEYHQGYYLTNPVRYRFYKESCGRVRRLEQIWGAEAGAPDYS